MQIKLTEFLNLLQGWARPGVQLPNVRSRCSAVPKRDDTGRAVRPSRRLGLLGGLALLASSLAALQPLHAAPAAFPMQPGEVAATYWSRSQPDPNHNGFNVVVIDTRNPAAQGALTGQNWLAPMFHNEFPAVTANTWNRGNLGGEVFGICLDNANPPNIYVAATVIYGNAAGPGPGGVYKLDGNTGDITPFPLPSAGPPIPSGPASLGNICFDSAHNQFFVSDLDTGLIYRLDINGVQLPLYPPYDHGVSGRPNEPTLIPPTIPDSGTPGLTAAGRRVWGVQVYNNRLYYSVWNVDMKHPSFITANEIWSVGIANNGTFNLGSIKREILLQAFSAAYSGTVIVGYYSSPVSDIACSKTGKMLLAERSAYGSDVTYASSAHQSRVLEYKLVGGSWVASGINYSVGELGAHVNSAGGGDYDCKEDVFATGDALILNATVSLYGLQIIPAVGNTPATSISTSYLIDLNGDTSVQNKTQIGDVVVYRENCDCLAITNRSVDCIATNNTYAWNFCVTNLFNGPIGFLSFPDLPAGVTIEHDILQLNPVLQQGEGTCLTLYITNTTGTNFCFTIGAHSTNFFQCCSITNCLTFEPCCAYVPPGSVGGPSESLVPIPGQPNCYNYTVTVHNVSSEGAEYIFFTADPTYGCLTFTPDIVTLPTVLPPNGQVTVTVEVCLGPAPCGRCFLISLHDACCSTRHCLPSVAGGAGGAVAVGSPADGSLFMTPTSIPLAVTLTPDIKFSSVSYVANGEVVASNSVPPFSAIWSNAPAGDYVLRADGVETNGGGVWSSDPVNIRVFAATPPSIVAGSFWRYLDNGSDQGTAWRAPGFDDSLWAFGQAPLGYGNGNEATVINGGPATNRNVTTYFRNDFFVGAPSSVSNLTVRLLRDDGGIVYLNGVEIFRSNMPTGAVNFATLAAGPTDGTNETQFFSTSVSPSLLVAGLNSVAVEIHQVSRTNDDVSFDLALAANVVAGGPAAAPVLRNPGLNGSNIRFSMQTAPGVTYQVESSHSLISPNWQPRETIVGDGGVSALSCSITNSQRFYRVRVQ